MTRQLPLSVTASVILDHSGAGTAPVGPPAFSAIPGAMVPGGFRPGAAAAVFTPDPDAGGGTASAGPLSPGEQWTGLTASVRVATSNAEATCRIYAGASPTPGYFAAATTWGSTGASSVNMPAVRVGGAIWAVWAGGDPGARATLTIRGTRTLA
jgi:hypothetical protein